MLSKNNYQERLRKMDDKQERFSIRKFSVGAASVLVGTAILSMQNVQTVRADATTDTEKGTTDVTSKNDEQNKQKAYNQVVSEDQNKSSKTTDTTMEGQDSKVASFSASKNEGTFAETSSEDKTASTADATENKTSDTTKAIEDNKVDAVADKSTENKANTDATQESSDSKSTENKTTDAQKVESKVATTKATTDTANSVKSASTTSTDKTTSVNTTTFNTNQSSTAALFSASALSESKALAATPRASSATTNTQAKNNNYKLVTSASALQQAINSGVAGVNIDRSIDASNVDSAITNTFAIVGINDAAVLNLGQKSLNNSGNLTLQDITINGAVSGNGTVNIKGNVTSNVSENNSLIKGATVDAANAALKDQTSTGTIGTQGTSWASGSSNQNGWTVKGWNYANFSGSKVNVAADANLTINRSAIGDGIHLANNGTVNVADGGQLTINMNTNNDLNTTARYHNAGIFAVGNGNLTTGYKSVVTLNTSIGQGIAMTGMRPYVTDTDVFGGYSARDRGDGSGQINLGQYSTLNFTGRDGVILGNNSNFNVGDSANVHFENKGRGVALDLAANSNINIDDHAVTYFHSVGKTTTNALGNTVGASGSFSGYNYIGVNEGGNITVGQFATFRVILEGRGNNNYDDVVSLDSQNSNTNAAFTSKTGAIVDIRDDNTNFYAELISFPLGTSNTRIDIHDPLMLNLQRYSSGGPTTGWMPIGGDMINTTSNQYTANLIYMSGSKGVFSVDGTDYVVYQKIKSDGSKQIWLNVNGVNIPMSGFQTKDIWNNQANPDVSIKGTDLTSGIRANQVHNYDGTPLTGKDAPYYGISTQRASQQIWFPHKTQMEVVGSHTNTIKYVYEDGTPVLDENGNQIVKTQNLNLTRKLTLDITDDKIEEIQKYALTHNADQTLEYIKNAQSVSEDSGWVYADAQGNTVTDPYATVVSPVEDGYTASIKSSNVPGITEGADGTSVTAKLQYKEDLVQNGELSNNYKQNGLSAILPDNYETVVVYKKAKEVTNTLKFYDDTTKSYITNIADQTATGKENDDVNFKDGASTVKSLEDQGYKFVNVTDGTPDDTNVTVLSGDTFSDVDFGKFGKDGKTFVVYLTHKVVPVTPDTPNVPSNSKVSKDDLTKSATRTIHYVENDQNGAELKESTVQTVNYTGTAYVDVVTGQMVNAKADGKDAQGNTTYVVDTDNKKQPSIAWTTDNDGKFAQVTPDASIKKGDDTWTTGVKSVDEKNAPDVSTITGKTTNEDVYVPYTLSQKTYTGTKETTSVTRVINYLDNETKQPVSDAVKQTATLSRTRIKDEKGNVIGYGSVSEDGHSYTLNNDWTIDNNGWVAQVSPDETAKGYKKTPHFEDGKDASTVAADAPSITDPQDVTVNVFYDHDTTPVTPDKPGHGLTHDDLNKDVTRTINYVDTTGAAVNGAPDGKSTYTQTAHFTRTAIVDKVNDKLLGYEINGDGSVDITPDAGDFAWKSTDANLPAVTSKTPSEVGYDSVDTPVVQATTVAYNSEPINVTVTYSKNAQQGSFQIHYIDEDNNNAILHQDTVSGKIGDSVTYSTADQIKLWESKGYVLDHDGYTTQTTINEDNNGKTYIVSFKHGRKNGTTETLVPTETIHFQYADGTKAADDVYGNAGDFKFTRTPIIDTVTGQVVDPGTWNKESYTFDDGQKNVKVINGYVADKVTYGNRTATPNDLNVEDTITYRKISNIIPVDENGNQIPGTTPVDYKNDPSDPTKVTPDEESPKVPSGWTISPDQPEGVTPNTTTNTAKVTPVDPTEPTKVVYTRDEEPEDLQYATVKVIYHDDTTGQDLESWSSDTNGNKKEVGTDTGYTQADINRVVQGYEAKGYYYVTTVVAGQTKVQQNLEDTVVYNKVGKLVPVGPDGKTPIPDAPTPSYPNDPTDPTKVIPNEPVPDVPGYTPVDPTHITPEDPTKDTPIPYTKDPVKAGLTVQYIDQDNNNSVIKSDAVNGNIGGKIDYSTASSITDFENKGYVLVTDGFTGQAGDEFTTENNGQVYKVVFKHGTRPVTPENPADPNKPVDPDHPDTPTPSNPNLSKEDLQKTVTRDFTYNFTDGSGHDVSEAPQTTTFTGKGTIDLVTGNLVTVDKDGNIVNQRGQITWNKTSDEFASVAVKNVDGYHVVSTKNANTDGSVDALTVNPNSNDVHVVVTYAPDVQADQTVVGKQVVHYVDGDNNNVKLMEDNTNSTFVFTYDGKSDKWNADSHKYDNATAPVINGYVAEKKTYEGQTGTPTDPKKEITIVYHKVGKIIPVGPDGKTPIPNVPTPSYPNDPTDPTKVIPNEPVPDVPGMTPSTPTVTPEDPTKDTPVPYTKDPVKAGLTVQYIDQDDNNSVIKSDAVNGNIGDKIDYSTASSITDFENKGYVLVTDGFTGQAGDEFTTENNGQVYKVVFKHGTRPVTPENPADPNKPVDPDHPDTPTPSNPNLSKTDLQKTITRTVEYKYADGTQAHEPVKQELTFTGKGTIDLVTGNLVTVDKDGNITSQNGKITWNHDSQEFEAVPAIDHDGYYISSINQSNSTASVDGQTGAVGTETVTPNNQNGNIVITLTRNPDVPVAAQGSINYIDDTTGQTIESANFSGNVGQKINYTTAGSIKNWEAKGYNLVSNNFKDGEEVFTDGKNAFEVHLVHATTPVTPENPGKPGEPVNPTNPDDPHKYPDNYVPQELAKTVTRDVTYVYADGSQAEAPVHQEVKFTGSGYLDLVTGEYVTVDNNGKITGKGQINWTPESANFDATKSIDTSKYQIVGIKENNTTANVDQTTGVVAGETVTQNSNNSSIVITLADKPAPVVEKGSITVRVHDLTDNVDLPQYGKESGEQEVGTSFTYDKSAVITELINKGYKLVDGGEDVPSEVAKGAKTITILVEHDTVPVTPENPGKPGEPINPNDPDGPKWPEGTDENSVKRTGTQTIHYEGAGDKTPSDDVQTFDFTRNMVVDKVTGKVIDGGSWNVTSHTFGYKDTPVIDGYHADKRNAGGTVVTPDDLNKIVTVNYSQNGKIIPTDPSGTPISNVPTPTYPTDPTDPTKVVPDQPVPKVPDMTPSTPTVTPEDPGKDTPVPYNPVKTLDKVTTVEGKQIVHFVDGDNGNTPLRDPNTQTHEFKITNGVPDESSHTFTLVDVPVIPGYVAEVKSAGGKTVTPDTPLAEVTVVYHKVGKIVPVDPNGTPIPNVPTPSYTNDPTDPTKVVPDEPVPAITGKTPDKTSVTPVDPTKDTPVVYKDNEVPATPNSQKAVVNFIDVNTGKLIKTSGILSGRPGEDINKLYSSAEVIKQLEEAGYEVVYNAFDGDGVTKYFDDDDNTTQQFTVALKLKEKAKTPDPVVPAPETPAKEPEAPAEKVSRPEQSVKQNVSVPTPQKPVEKKTNNKKEVLPQTGADHNEAASILGAVAAAIGMTSLIGAKRRKKDDK
ncbi:YSIRK-type signal peptide-containing protein [Lactobacillus paragasseri]|uniref:mucin-binding protein n=1 Tax=Lactobacillus paragasseri TaxID=2107999 RepID=UPI0029C53C59|nr:YSIRK-type signal peptide-containing protein [Lactobacillus paragasseri]MDX5068964.1 YSIRK-type signal peptide-containing protein [Lactobacillus paragasseri]MDX5097513.1 YSIRK-type signal peptide-containing protein [Lactobacillus paragasseri]